MACFEVDILFGFDPCRTAFGHESKQDIGLGLCCGFCAWSCACLGLFASQRAVGHWHDGAHRRTDELLEAPSMLGLLHVRNVFWGVVTGWSRHAPLA